MPVFRRLPVTGNDAMRNDGAFHVLSGGITAKIFAINATFNQSAPAFNGMSPRSIGMPAIAAAVILSCVVLAACTGTPGTGNPAGSDPVVPATTATVPKEGTTPQGSADENGVAGANNRFASDLYSYLADDPGASGKNIFFSPFSLSSAFAITYEGARGTTADEIRAVFRFSKNATVLREGYAAVNAGIGSGDSAYTLRTANALWAEKTYPFLPEFTGTAERYYGANTTNLDFINRPDESRTTINRWVEEKTADRIKNLLPAGSIDPMTRLVITNAVYFKGTWVKQFDANRTQDAAFTTLSGTTVTVRMMQNAGGSAVYRYLETGDLQVLDMPYSSGSGRELSMLVLLPKGSSLSPAKKALDPEELASIRDSLSSQRVDVYFPKFTLETEYQLAGTLSEMGMPSAFTGAADFSGMDGTEDLSVSDVFHKAFVDVNEEGTEAAAATAVVMTRAAIAPESPVPVFRADHPFLFLIQDKETGTVLFVGRVADPAGS